MGLIDKGSATPYADLHSGVTKRQLRLRFYMLLMVADAVALLAGVALAEQLRYGHIATPQGLTVTAAILPLFVILNVRSYNGATLDKWQRGAARSVIALLAAAAIVLFVAYCLKASAAFSRFVLFTALASGAAVLVALRALIGLWCRRVFAGSSSSRLLILDETDLPQPTGVRVLRADAIDFGTEGPHPIVLDRLAQSLRGVDEAFVACAPDRRAKWSLAMKGSAVRTELLVPELDTLGALGNEHFAGIATVLVSAGTFRFQDRLLKRLLDLAIALPAVLFIAPLLILVSIAVKLDSRGPVLFVQQRVGKGNRIFRMYKFRSMRSENCDADGKQSTRRDDDRITRVGRFIRSTSIDELPQLFNIVRGEMSFVGPRPHAMGSLAGDQLFWEVDHRYHHRHACKPGLTGLAQIRGFRGATHRREDLVNRLDADLEYINGWSVKRDLMILFATVKVVVHDNAF